MPEKRLRELLTQLHDELGSPEPVEERDRELLEALAQDIQQRLDDAGSDTATLNARLTKTAARLERTHPRVADTLRGLLDTLAKMGI